jgi:hypothetical protein
MARKRDIGKTLEKGSPKQRATVLFSHKLDSLTLGGREAGEGFLSNSEELRLEESFNSSREIKLYNSYNRFYNSLLRLFPYFYELTARYETETLREAFFLQALVSREWRRLLLSLPSVKKDIGGEKLLSIIGNKEQIFQRLKRTRDGTYLPSKGEANLEDLLRVYRKRRAKVLGEYKATYNAVKEEAEARGLHRTAFIKKNALENSLKEIEKANDSAALTDAAYIIHGLDDVTSVPEYQERSTLLKHSTLLTLEDVEQDQNIYNQIKINLGNE